MKVVLKSGRTSPVLAKQTFPFVTAPLSKFRASLFSSSDITEGLNVNSCKVTSPAAITDQEEEFSFSRTPFRVSLKLVGKFRLWRNSERSFNGENNAVLDNRNYTGRGPSFPDPLLLVKMATIAEVSIPMIGAKISPCSI